MAQSVSLRGTDISYADLAFSSLPFVGFIRGYYQVLKLHTHLSIQLEHEDVPLEVYEALEKKIAIYHLTNAVSLISTSLVRIAMTFFRVFPFSPVLNGFYIAAGLYNCCHAYQTVKDIESFRKNEAAL